MKNYDHRIRQALINYMRTGKGVTHHVTLATNWDTNIRLRPSEPRFSNLELKVQRGVKMMHLWEAMANQQILGRGWRPSGVRLGGAAFIEHPETNLHWHVGLSLPATVDVPTFEAVASEKWLKLVPGGRRIGPALRWKRQASKLHHQVPVE